ncbi:hypothetical protein ACFVP8_04085 [Viridibacillus arvi]
MDNGGEMKKLNNYFLGDEAHWSDKVWFYGALTAMVIIGAIGLWA